MLVYRKNIILLFAVFFFNSSLHAQGKKNIKTNKIKSSTEFHVLVAHEKDSTYKDTYTVFDTNGNTVEEIKFNPNGSIRKKRTYKFDGSKNKLEELEYEGTTLVKKQQYAYNANGNKILEVTYDGTNKLIKKEVFIYNRLGLKVEHKIYNGNNVLVEIHKFTYKS